MARLTALPEQSIIDGFKGKLDYYLWLGVPCVRKWPRKPDVRGIPQVEAHWDAFAYATKIWKQLPAEVQASYNAQATGTGISGRDIQIKGFLAGIYRYPH